MLVLDAPAAGPTSGSGPAARPCVAHTTRVVAPPDPVAYARVPCRATPPASLGPDRAVALDNTVLEAFGRGEDAAVRAVFREYAGLVHAVALRVLGRRDLAEEATQQTFVRAWRAAASFDADRPLGPWLATIARRVAIDVHRREARREASDLGDVPSAHAAVVTLPPSVDAVHDAWAVREALEDLPDDEREVVRLQHLEGFSHSEIAERLGVPVGTVKSRSFRAHKRLAVRLGHLRGDPSNAPPSPDPPSRPVRPEVNT